MTRLRDRPTPDLIAVSLTAVVLGVVVFTVLVVVVTEIWRPEVNTSQIVSRVSGLVTTMTGAIIGYLAGRGARAENGNGAPK